MTRHPIATTLGGAALTLAVALGLGGGTGAALGQGEAKKAAAQGGKDFASREEVNTYYADKFAELEKQHIGDLAKVAAKEQGDAANATYRLLFNLTIARNLYAAAEGAAEQAIAKQDTLSPDVQALAHLVNVLAEADRGKYDESLTHLKEFVDSRKPNERPSGQLGADTVIAIGEAYFQRLSEAGRYDVARQLCEYVVSKTPSPAVKTHFTERLGRLQLLGKPAPAIAAKDVDGDPASLADLKGKVVLVEFWATWCPPCSPQILRINAVREKYKDQGFEVIGVNVDALREGAGGAQAVLPAVRRFLVDHAVTWPNVLNGAGQEDYAKAYGVDDIPANFLVGRDGTIIGFELSEGSLSRAVGEAVGKK